MDLKICGIIDILLIVCIVVTLIIGYKKGFLKKAIGLISLFVALALAFVFCTQLANWLEDVGLVYDPIYEKIYNNVITADIFQSTDGLGATTQDVLVNIGVPKFLANMFASNIPDALTPIKIAENVAHYFSHMLTVIISFFILFIGVFICAIILKIITKILRGNKLIRFIDGLLGMVLYFCLFMIFVYVVFTIFHYMEDYAFFSPVKNFLDIDMKLNEDTFRLSKYFYEHNIVYAILNIFF